MNKTIPFLKESFSDREILICREMTKIYEEYLRYKVDELKTLDENLKGEKFLKYKKRLDHEINIICEMNYSSYFLIVSDYIIWAKKIIYRLDQAEDLELAH